MDWIAVHVIPLMLFPLLLLLPLPLLALQCYNQAGVQVTSVYGVECVECSLAGYLTSGGCSCYEPNLLYNCVTKSLMKMFDY